MKDFVVLIATIVAYNVLDHNYFITERLSLILTGVISQWWDALQSLGTLM